MQKEIWFLCAEIAGLAPLLCRSFGTCGATCPLTVATKFRLRKSCALSATTDEARDSQFDEWNQCYFMRWTYFGGRSFFIRGRRISHGNVCVFNNQKSWWLQPQRTSTSMRTSNCDGLDFGFAASWPKLCNQHDTILLNGVNWNANKIKCC